jgi:hypothetical protein
LTPTTNLFQIITSNETSYYETRNGVLSSFASKLSLEFSISEDLVFSLPLPAIIYCLRKGPQFRVEYFKVLTEVGIIVIIFVNYL